MYASPLAICLAAYGHTLPYLSLQLLPCNIDFTFHFKFSVSNVAWIQHGLKFYHSATTGDRIALWCILSAVALYTALHSATVLHWYSQCPVTRTLQLQATTPVVLRRLTGDAAFCLHTTASSPKSVISWLGKSNHDTAFRTNNTAVSDCRLKGNALDIYGIPHSTNPTVNISVFLPLCGCELPRYG